MGDNESRMTLFPNGPPSEQIKTKCKELLIYCGADVRRYHDQTWSDLSLFLKYISRIHEVLEPEKQPLIVLTHTLPLQFKVIKVRTEIVQKLPHLQHAVWIIFVDLAEDPSFPHFAKQYGMIDQPIHNVPFWLMGKNRYMILTPDVTDIDFLKLRSRMACAQADDHLAKNSTWNPDPPSSVRLKPAPLFSRTLTGLVPAFSKAS